MFSQPRFNLKPILFLLVLTASAQGRSQALNLNSEQIKNVSSSRVWRTLLDYRARWGYFSERSLVDTKDFFISKHGSQNAEAELLATIESLNQGTAVFGEKKQTAYCAFVARRKFLEKTFNFKWPKQKCEHYEKVFAGLKPKSLSILFAASYPNNPASMFGHTLFKINSDVNNDLLNHGIGYAAHMPPDEPAANFMFLGLFGGYWGRFSFEPYYKKVNEYNNVESRDIWEYELELTEDEIWIILDHVWELESTGWSRYYFFDENCALKLLMLLEAARPDWVLSDLKIYFIPGETVKKVALQPGAVREVRFRPSLQKQMQKSYSYLNNEEKEIFKKLVEKDNFEDLKISDFKNRWVLDALITYYQYLRQKKAERKVSKNLESLQNLLLVRSGLKNDSESRTVAEVSKNTRPDLGHDSYRYALAYGYKDGEGGVLPESFYELHIRSSYHDLLNNDEGYADFTEIEMPTVDIRYYSEQEKWRLNRLQIFRSTSIFPLSYLESRPSWSVNIGLFNARDIVCNNCVLPRVEAAGGGALGFFDNQSVLYGLIGLKTEVSPDLSRGYRYGPKLSVYSLSRVFNNGPLPKSKLRLGYEHFWDVDQSERASSFGTYNFDFSSSLSRNNEIRFNYSIVETDSLKDDDTELKFSYLRYFN